MKTTDKENSMLHWFAKRLREMQEVKRDERGFTLIELLVVIIIIGILAAIAIPTFLAQRDNAREATAESDLRNLASAASTCAGDVGGSYDKCGTGADGSTTGTVAATDILVAKYDFNQSTGTTLNITTADANKWVATAKHNEDSACTTYTFDSDTGKITNAEVATACT